MQEATSSICHYESRSVLHGEVSAAVTHCLLLPCSDIVQAMQDPSGGVALEAAGQLTKGAPHYFTGQSLLFQMKS